MLLGFLLLFIPGQGLLTLLAELTPVSAALMLFTQGASGIYQVYRAHRLVQDVEPEGSRALADRLAPLVAERVQDAPAIEAL